MYVTDVNEDIMCLTRSGNRIYWMLTSEVGAPNSELRYIEIPPGGQSSHDSHPHEQEVFVVKGQRQVRGPEGETRLTTRMVVFVPGHEMHQWVNADAHEPFGFVCVVPKGAEAESTPPCG